MTQSTNVKMQSYDLLTHANDYVIYMCLPI